MPNSADADYYRRYRERRKANGGRPLRKPPFIDPAVLPDIISRERLAIYRDVIRALDYPEEFPAIDEFRITHGVALGTLRAVLGRRDKTTFGHAD